MMEWRVYEDVNLSVSLHFNIWLPNIPTFVPD